MALPPVTDPQAVVDAMAEFEELGQDEFLARYGFGRAASYYVQHEGRFYDSKALLSAAYFHQSGQMVSSAEFSGGEVVARAFDDLGFRVTRPGSWHFRIGDTTQRAAIAEVYGGATQGGVQPSKSTPNVMLFTDESAGGQHGYNFDGWDDGNSTVYYYTGAGQVGDHEVSGQGNKAILTHLEKGRTLRLFESEQREGRPGGKLQTYLGAFRLDEDEPYRLERAPDREKNMRSVFVFKLRSDESAPNAGDPQAQGSTSDLDDQVYAEFVQPERNDVREFETAPTVGRTARRKESELVKAFEDHLESIGHEVGRMRFRLPRGQGQLVTDTFDRTDNMLYEAKSNINRGTIRLGLGQILDYRRLFTTPVGCSLLLPEEPITDLVELLLSYEVGATWPDDDGWLALAPSVVEPW